MQSYSCCALQLEFKGILITISVVVVALTHYYATDITRSLVKNTHKPLLHPLHA